MLARALVLVRPLDVVVDLARDLLRDLLRGLALELPALTRDVLRDLLRALLALVVLPAVGDGDGLARLHRCFHGGSCGLALLVVPRKRRSLSSGSGFASAFAVGVAMPSCTWTSSLSRCKMRMSLEVLPTMRNNHSIAPPHALWHTKALPL